MTPDELRDALGFRPPTIAEVLGEAIDQLLEAVLRIVGDPGKAERIRELFDEHFDHLANVLPEAFAAIVEVEP